jgi:hypothetical protein
VSSSRQLEILCAACGADTILVREPRYEGLRKTGETLKCAACGREYAGENEVPFKQKATPRVFNQSDAARRVSVFQESEKGRTCRYCRHYVVNPFTQRCGLSFKPVEATDSCGKFAEPDKPDKKPDGCK